MDNPVSIGQIVSHYRIVERIGAGGMGVVFRAIDERLEREVALKFLPRAAIADPATRERFRREARTLAKLSHPNIAAIYEFASQGEIDFLAMEYVRGATLIDELRTGALDLSRVLALGSQICDALDAAHEQGVVHRDLKPANVAVSPRGKAKILDFGIAKLLQSEVTSTVTDLTGSAIVGTLPYMAPEQLRGEGIDHRTDIYAAGAVLYEMATGRRPYASEQPGRLVDAILHDEAVPPSRLNQRLPAGFDALVLKALQKEPSQRYQAARELGLELDQLASSNSRVIGTSPGGALGRWKVGVAIAAGLALVATGLALNRLWKHEPMSPNPLIQRQLTSNTSENSMVEASISPDGKSLAFSSVGGLFLRSLETGDTRSITLPNASSVPTQLAWFPDGDRFLIALPVRGITPGSGSPQNIWAISTLGWSSRNLGSGISGSPSPDGSRIAVVDSEGEIWLMNTDGRNRRRIRSYSDTGAQRVVWAPDGQRLAYTRRRDSPIPGCSIETCDLEGRSADILPADRNVSPSTLCWLPGGQIVFARREPPPNETDSNLWEIEVHPKSGRPLGRPRRITNWVGSYVAGVSNTSDGERLVVLKSRAQMDIFVGDLSRKDGLLDTPHRLTMDDRNDWLSSWGRDSQTIFFNSDRNGDRDGFRMRVGEREAVAVTGGPGLQDTPTVSPDGNWILFWASDDSISQYTTGILMRIPVSGGPPERVLESKYYAGFRCAHFPGATSMLCERKQDGTMVFTSFDSVLGRRGEFGKAGAATRAPWDLSPDGSRIALLDRAWITLIKDGEPNRAFPVKGFDVWDPSLTWTANGDGFYISGYLEESPRRDYLPGILQCDLNGNARILSNVSTLRWVGSPRPSPDGRYLGFNSLSVETNAWELRNF